MIEIIKKLRDNLFVGKEGNILFLGLALIFMMIILILSSYIINPEFANKITGIVFTNIVVGRVPALSFGYAAGLSHFVVICTNIMIELILVSIIYPLFVFSFKDILHIDALEEFFTQVKNKKEQYKDKFEKYGTLTLFIFVFIPFWMTGPIVGSIIGYLIGMNHYKNISIVFIATVLAISLWGLFLQEIIDTIMLIDSSIVWISLGIIISVILFLKLRKL